jgi:hypothetical protein
MNDEQRLIEAINRSMQESAAQLKAMGREPYSVTREEAERQVAMLLKAKEEFYANNIPSHPRRKTGSQGCEYNSQIHTSV